MADVRSMLRQERAARQQSSRPQKTSAAPAAVPTGRKRKAADDEVEDRKRSKTEELSNLPSSFFDGAAAEQDIDPVPELPDPAPDEATPPVNDPTTSTITNTFQQSNTPRPSQAQADEITEEELAAFAAEMDDLPAAQPSRPTYTAGAVIEAAPMTAAEVAAKAREEQSAQRGRREVEIEAEKEEATRQLQDEFEEMDELEQRVQRLREKREALRSMEIEAQNVVPAEVTLMNNEEEDSESDDEDWDDWRFRPA